MKEFGTLLGIILTVVVAAVAFGICCVGVIVAPMLWVKIVDLVFVIIFTIAFTIVIFTLSLTMGRNKK